MSSTTTVQQETLPVGGGNFPGYRNAAQSNATTPAPQQVLFDKIYRSNVLMNSIIICIPQYYFILFYKSLSYVILGLQLSTSRPNTSRSRSRLTTEPDPVKVICMPYIPLNTKYII